jgi:hypothetical protein
MRGWPMACAQWKKPCLLGFYLLTRPMLCCGLYQNVFECKKKCANDSQNNW